MLTGRSYDGVEAAGAGLAGDAGPGVEARRPPAYASSSPPTRRAARSGSCRAPASRRSRPRSSRGPGRPRKLRGAAKVWARPAAPAGVNLDLAPVMDTVPEQAGGQAQPADRQVPARVRLHARTSSRATASRSSTGWPTAGSPPRPSTSPASAGCGPTPTPAPTSPTGSPAATTPTSRRSRPPSTRGVPFMMMSTAYYARLDPKLPAAFSPFVIGTDAARRPRLRRRRDLRRPGRCAAGRGVHPGAAARCGSSAPAATSSSPSTPTRCPRCTTPSSTGPGTARRSAPRSTPPRSASSGPSSTSTSSDRPEPRSHRDHRWPPRDRLPLVRAYRCRVCDNPLYFENSVCVSCGTALGFSREERAIVPVDEDGRYVDANGLVWACAPTSTSPAAPGWRGLEGGQCFSCDLTRTRPQRRGPVGLVNYPEAERAKRHLIVELDTLGFPVIGKDPETGGDPENGLAFDLLSRPVARGTRRSSIGHENGRDHHRPRGERRRLPREGPGQAGRALPHDARPLPPRGRPLLRVAAGPRRRADGALP